MTPEGCPAEVRSLECRVYEVPTDAPEADGTLAWTSTVVVAVVARAGDRMGLGWTYASGACQAVVERELADVVVGSQVDAVTDTHERMRRACRNLGRTGVVACAISAVDIALWDLHARLLGVPLSSLWGGTSRRAPVYGSGGFTTYDDRTTAAQLSAWAERGISRFKIKIGESWGTNVDRDLSRVALARSVVGAGAELFVDANGAYRPKQAIRIGETLFGDHGVVWFEEPVSSDDLAGLRQVRERTPPDVAAGEYGYDEWHFSRMLDAQAVDCLQIDVTRCGGYTSWLRAAALAGAHGLEVSGHCAPHLHAPLAGAVPNLRHIEYFHDHVRADGLLFEGLPAVEAGSLVGRPPVGHGITLDGARAEPYRAG
ncbi:MAG TPA: enolase C-terminal domain-like protein [Acidimicrobiales bacterium]|nr:enolase C-terminal domain-like protein [Acidimicrobiales bacterium]